MNAADLSWPEDAGFQRAPRASTDPEQDYIDAQANLALAGARRNRYGALPGRDADICAQLNADINAARIKCDRARAALEAAPKGEDV